MKTPTDEQIRTSLTYCLPAGLTESEWEVIINNVKDLLDRQKESFIKELEGMKFPEIKTQNESVSEMTTANHNPTTAISQWSYNQALSEVIKKLKEI